MRVGSRSKPRSLRQALLASLAAGSLLLAACGSDTAPSTATGSPTAAEGDTNQTEPAAQTEQETAAEEDPEPEGPVHVAFSSVPQVEKVPQIIAIEGLEADGYDASMTFLQKSEDPVAAVVRGDANFGYASSSAVFTGIGQGAPVVAVMQAMSPNYALVAPVDVEDPSGLDGLRVGIHAAVSSTTLYTTIALEDYPDTEPELLVVPGSSKRIQALAAGELDASVVQLTDLPKLEELAPGEYHVIHNFAQENPEVIDSVLFTSTDTLESNPELVEAVIERFLDQFEAAYEDVDMLAQRTTDLVADIDEEMAQELAQIYVDAEVWPRDGGLTEEGVRRTLTALVEGELIEDAPEASEVFDRRALDAVLDRR